jgi:transcriptional regulator
VPGIADIVRLRRRGLSLRKIAERLKATGVAISASAVGDVAKRHDAETRF